MKPKIPKFTVENNKSITLFRNQIRILREEPVQKR